MGCICSKQSLEIDGRFFKITKALGEGGFSTVHVVQEVGGSRRRYALKKMICHSDVELARAKREIQAHQSLGSHPNVLSIEAHQIGEAKGDRAMVYRTGELYDATEVLLVLPLYEKGTLLQELQSLRVRSQHISEDRVLRLFLGICRGVEAFHTQSPTPLAHRDLKPGNILMAEDDTPVLMDFGSCAPARVVIADLAAARSLIDDAAELCTMPYRPPEFFNVAPGASLDERTDIWSLGCLLFALCFFRSPYDDIYERGDSIALAVQSGNIRIPQDSPYSPAVHNLIKMLLQVEMTDRPYIGDVIRAVMAVGGARFCRRKQDAPCCSLGRRLARRLATVAGRCLQSDRGSGWSSSKPQIALGGLPPRAREGRLRALLVTYYRDRSSASPQVDVGRVRLSPAVSVLASAMAAHDSDPGWKFLRQSQNIQLKEQAGRKFDNKTHVWIPDAEEGFVIAETKSVSGNVITLQTAKGEAKISKDEAQEINPAKFEKTEDMSNLTFLNEASVLHNLRQRYYAMMIYTYSGLFCVVINPYKRLPIYSESVANMYIGRRRNEMPPHLFAVSDEAYRHMMDDHENQSMLITGESGAGKTENTKKVISYFANIGSSQQGSKKAVKKGATLEEQIVQTNPVLEAFGNAKTVRNNNSSRFGKFIRIHFNDKGKLAGGDIAHYLLEKSRVIKQAAGERSFHIFYQIMSNKIKGLREGLLLEDDLKKYHFVSQAELTVPGMDDQEEMQITDEAFDIMGFDQTEKTNLYKLCGAIMHMGEMKFKQRPREEQAESDGTGDAENACKLFSVDAEKFVQALLRPRVKVGTEWVNKGQNLDQVNWAVGALAKAIYARMFKWLIERCNKTLDAQDLERQHYIGVLDIAGFEIFDLNSFEQLWINFVNERLQQFFNHHMFVLEQEEYQREGIIWDFIDFGLDLQACIELIEKPLGIISMLDEECIVPKATDMTLVTKLSDQHLGKHPNFQKARPPKGKQAEAHFAVVHYAGTVRYNVKAWLEKNKDPLNDSAVAVLKTTDKNALLQAIWEDYKTQLDVEEDTARGKKQVEGKKKGKAASFMTVSMMYRESLNSLMTMLHTTHPHFIRCIIPNEKKASGVIDAPLVLNQLTCNGVLEGIRICRKGFPNRLQYPDFRHRYAILAATEATDADPKRAGDRMMKKLEEKKSVTAEEYRIGHTKIFFKAGLLARLEDLRDEALSIVITKFQCACRGYLALCDYKRRLDQVAAAVTVQSNVRSWCTLRTWPWFRLFARVKPMLAGMRSNEEVEKLEKQLKELEALHKAEADSRQRFEQELLKLKHENQGLNGELSKESEARKLAAKQAADLEQKVADLEGKNEGLDRAKRQLEGQNEALAKNVSSLEANLKSTEADKFAREREIAAMHEEMGHQDRTIAKLTQDRKVQEEANRQLGDNLDAELIRSERLEATKVKLETELEMVNQHLYDERRAREELAKGRKKLESEVKSLTDQLEMARSQKHELEGALKKREGEILSWRSRADDDANLISKLQINIRELIARIEQLEEEVENEHRGRQRAERMRLDLQNELDLVNQRMEEASGQLSTQIHLNSTRKMELARLHTELESRNLNHETHIADLCSMQWVTLKNLRDLSVQAQSLENEAARVLTFRDSLPKRGPDNRYTVSTLRSRAGISESDEDVL
uniref:Myosin heavy chain n=1 Tax=Plectus sambesii TaxID=2011161 RepID=A0A914W0L8_9BILA